MKPEIEMQIRVAEKVRQDSQDQGMLTSTDTIDLLLDDLEAGSDPISLADMQKDKQFQDIKSTVTATGVIYLYSETYISQELAETLAQAEDIKTRLAEKVREDSKNLSKLTDVDALCAADATFDLDKIKAGLTGMESDESCQDIKSVVTATGAIYLYSETFITGNYAAILLRAEVNDPCATIALTVRDESRIYPRPTPIEVFGNPIFNIKPEELEVHLTSTLERQDYKDIKLVTASTGARYLYSDLYLEDYYATSLVEWKEVGEVENP